MNLFVQIIIPFLILIVLNTFIYKKIKGFEKRSRVCKDGTISLSTLKVPLRPQNTKGYLNPNQITTVTPITSKTYIRRCSSCTSFPNLKKDLENRTRIENKSLQQQQDKQDNSEENTTENDRLKSVSFNPDRKGSNLYESECIWI